MKKGLKPMSYRSPIRLTKTIMLKPSIRFSGKLTNTLMSMSSRSSTYWRLSIITGDNWQSRKRLEEGLRLLLIHIRMYCTNLIVFSYRFRCSTNIIVFSTIFEGIFSTFINEGLDLHKKRCFYDLWLCKDQQTDTEY